jgi:hypothetical protein
MMGEAVGFGHSCMLVGGVGIAVGSALGKGEGLE